MDNEALTRTFALMATLSEIRSICIKISIVYLIFGIIGNLLIIAYFIGIQRREMVKMNPYHYLIIKLASVDLLVCLLYGFINISSIVDADYIISPKTNIVFILEAILLPLSTLSICVLTQISLLRYHSIVHPLREQWKKRKFSFVTIGVCFISLCFSATNAALYEGWISDWQSSKNSLFSLLLVVYKIVLAFTDLVIPFIAMIFFYHKSSRKLNENSVVVNSNEERQIRKRNRTALKTLKFLLIIYVICVFIPRIFDLVLYLLVLYANQFDLFNPVNLKLQMVHNVLFYNISIQSFVLNFVVYVALMKDFRRFLKKTFFFWLKWTEFRIHYVDKHRLDLLLYFLTSRNKILSVNVYSIVMKTF